MILIYFEKPFKQAVISFYSIGTKNIIISQINFILY